MKNINKSVQIEEGQKAQDVGAFAPLKGPVFRRIWTASVLSNFGQLILGVAAAWEMTRLTSSASMVALVQTALMLPLMLVAVPAGAIADMFDRRMIAMTGLSVALICSALLTTLAVFDMVSPWILLAFCAMISAGVAIYGPAWQASIGEQVERHHLPAAVALGTISYNLARSVGPAVGGVVILAAGAKAAFGINTLSYLPLILAFYLWNRGHVPSRLPPERIDRAIISGARYVFHSSAIRKVLTRVFLFGLVGATANALAPLIVKDMLGGDASTFGILLGASGIGAVAGAFMVNQCREKFGVDRATSILAVISGAALVLVGFSRWIPLTCFGLFIAGGANILTIALLNVSVQMSVPRWVTARALSLFTSAIAGGVAIGSWIWGMVAGHWSVDIAIIASGIAMFALPIFGLFLRLPEGDDTGVKLIAISNEPEISLAINMRSGPIVIEVDYRIDPDNARSFYDAMRSVGRLRLRNGAFGWAITRDIADVTLWTERYQFPTWGDYLRMRDRFTQADMDAQEAADAFIRGGAIKLVRRRLERPFGSVRWRANSPDLHQETIGYIGP